VRLPPHPAARRLDERGGVLATSDKPPAANAKKGAAQRGKALPDHLRRHLDRTGWTPTPETRARMSATQTARGRVRRGAGGPPWTEEEDVLLDRLGPVEAAAETGRTLAAVYLRRRRLRRARGEPARPPERPWTPEELTRLGTAPDAELAAELGRSESAVRTKRWKRRRAGL
jgi:hypothetical protein